MSLQLETAYAELVERVHGDAFDAAYPLDGAFTRKIVKGRSYLYFQRMEDGRQRQRYVGPESPELIRAVERHGAARRDLAERRELVRALRGAGHGGPDQAAADVLGALSEAGAFRLRAVLVGTYAYQAYGPMLGTRLGRMNTNDVDIAQFQSVSMAVEDRTQPLADVLRGVDPTFSSVPSVERGDPSVSFRNAANLRVDLIVPNRGPDRSEPMALPALGAHGQPLRFLDFLIREPAPAALLHGVGIPVMVPAPERYALHKGLVAQLRPAGSAKVGKDWDQAASLVRVLAGTRPYELKEAWRELLDRGPRWRELGAVAQGRLDAMTRGQFSAAVSGGPQAVRAAEPVVEGRALQLLPARSATPADRTRHEEERGAILAHLGLRSPAELAADAAATFHAQAQARAANRRANAAGHGAALDLIRARLATLGIEDPTRPPPAERVRSSGIER